MYATGPETGNAIPVSMLSMKEPTLLIDADDVESATGLSGILKPFVSKHTS